MHTSINENGFYLGNFYEVNDIVLGRGSFSTVYLAVHKLFDTKVALKVIDRNNIQEEYVKKNLHREAKILRKLNHPNIVNFYEEFTYNELYCLALEYINGPDLSHYLKRQTSQRVSEKTAKVMFYQMVSAVSHMHQASVLHRDLKQENILLENYKVIKIVDFGLSNTYQPRVKLRTHCGSLVYAAPELFQHRSVYGAGVDLWSLGVILYSMVVGSMPFEVSKDIQSTISQGKKERFLQRILEGLTAKNWEDMGNLSYECTDLLDKLLQPNQYRRIRIEEVRRHPWFLNDFGWREKLPQLRLDLKRKFEPKIIDIMAGRLHKRKEFLRMHLASRDKYDRVAAIYFILQDTLVKEVLYPPEEPENSVMYRLEYERKSQIPARQSLQVYGQEQEDGGKRRNSKFSVGQSFPCSSINESKFVHEILDEPAVKVNKKGFSEKLAHLRKQISDGGFMENKASEGNTLRRKSWIPTSKKLPSNIKSSVPRSAGNENLSFSVGQSSQCYSTGEKKFVSSNPVQQKTYIPEIQVNRKGFAEFIANIKKRAGEEERIENMTSKMSAPVGNPRSNVTDVKSPFQSNTDNESSERSMGQSSRSFTITRTEFDSHIISSKKPSGNQDNQVNRKTSGENKRNIRKGIGDGGCLENEAYDRYAFRGNSRTPLSNVKLSIHPDTENESSDSSIESTRSSSTTRTNFVSDIGVHKIIGKPEKQVNKKPCGKNKTYMREEIGDGYHLGKKPSERNVPQRKPWMPTSNNASLSEKSSILRNIDDQRINSSYPPNEHRFRSYQKSRPTRVSKDCEFKEQSKERKDFKEIFERNNKIRESKSNISGELNFKGKVNLLREKFEKDFSIAPQTVDERNCNFKSQRRTSMPVSNSVYSQSTSVKRLSDLDRYTAHQIAEIQKTYVSRPNTNEKFIKSSQMNQVYNKNSFQEYPVNSNAFSYNQNQSSQMKQKSMVVRRSKELNQSHSRDKNEVNRLHNFKSQQTYTQTPTFDASNYESKRLYNTTPSAFSKKVDRAKK